MLLRLAVSLLPVGILKSERYRVFDTFPIAFLADTINLTILIEVIPNEFQVAARRQGVHPGAYSGK
ncbi:hypothetical protein J4732_14170 [Serratia marcescens]|uniref:Uncharacterized protein n=1 Tax=Serratia marcescens TaxID=615 RepID=A0A939SR95_SERMA|nr:hypothetical protein [Serratia marcescens]